MSATTQLYALACIGVAVGLSLLVGAERAFFHKAAGMRTHTLVGLGAAVFTVVSKYGFQDVIAPGSSGGDGSRVAAQIVSGVGFLGAGLIFVKRGSVRGLTTAASIWLVAAIGMAAGAGMWLVAGGVTAVYLAVAGGIRPLAARLPHAHSTSGALHVSYEDGKGILRHIVHTIGSHGLTVSDLTVAQSHRSAAGQRVQHVEIAVSGTDTAMREVLPDIEALPGVLNLASRPSDTDI